MNTAPRLRIAVLNRQFGARFGGAERYSVAVAEQLAQRHEVHVFAQILEDLPPGVQGHRIAGPLAKPRWLNQLWFALASGWRTRRGFDVVHSHENTWHGQVQTVHVRPFRVGFFMNRAGWRRPLRWLQLLTSPRLLSYAALEGARLRPHAGRCVVASSETVAQELIHAYPQTAACLHTIAPGVQLPPALDAQERATQQAQARQQLGLPADATLVLFVGNDYLKKGLPALLQALALPEAAGLHVAVVGQPTHRVRCQALAQRLGVQARVHFLGSLADVGPAYRAANLLAHPTTEDTYAMVVLEALAHGLPVVVSGPEHCGIAAELAADAALQLQDPHDAQALATALTRIVADPALAARLAERGRHWASQHSWAQAALAYEQLYLQCAQATRAQPPDEPPQQLPHQQSQ